MFIGLDVLDSEDYLHCYCDEYPTYEQLTMSVCRTYQQDQLILSFVQSAASVVVVSINEAFQILVKRSSAWERHHSQDTQQTSEFRRLFVLKVLNLGVIPIIINSMDAISYLEDDLGLRTGVKGSEEFDVTWFVITTIPQCPTHFLCRGLPSFYVL